MAKMDFLILGHGGSGTSLLRGIINAHSRIECLFEVWGEATVDSQIGYWVNQGAANSLTWGNKLPLEQFWTREWKHSEIKSLISYFHIIWVVRRFKKWVKNQKPAQALDNWHKQRKLYWAMRNQRPTRIIEVSFEDLLLRPETEVRRVCAFLKIRFERKMLTEGLNNTGHKSYNYGKILTEKI